jgi:siroheme synthase (precorrin-2 oxidase/ferrochelatase)
MDLRRLRTFVAVAELGTVSRAALHLRISQSALSRQISDLEQEFRVRLFDRVGRRLVLAAIDNRRLVRACRERCWPVGAAFDRCLFRVIRVALVALNGIWSPKPDVRLSG